METFVVFVISIWVGITSIISLAVWIGDYRDFRQLEQQCEKQGYIQNTTTRLLCSKETK